MIGLDPTCKTSNRMYLGKFLACFDEFAEKSCVLQKIRPFPRKIRYEYSGLERLRAPAVGRPPSGGGLLLLAGQGRLGPSGGGLSTLRRDRKKARPAPGQ
jgi:hypothetical protein